MMITASWPNQPPVWLVPWARWFLGGKQGLRPLAPVSIPAWAWDFLKWCEWRHHGAHSPRPDVQLYIPQWAWTALSNVYAKSDPLPPPIQVHPLFHRYVFVSVLSNFSGLERAQARARGYFTILVLLGDGSDAALANARELDEKKAVYEAEGWVFGGWSAPMLPKDPASCARHDVDAIHRHSLRCWASDWEDWGEGVNTWRADEWHNEWVALGRPVPLLLSCLSSETPLYARSFNYQPWIASGDAIGPQVYGDAHPGYTVYNMLETMRNGGVPDALLAPTFGDVESLPTPYDDYANWVGSKGVWIGGQVKDWSRL